MTKHNQFTDSEVSTQALMAQEHANCRTCGQSVASTLPTPKPDYRFPDPVSAIIAWENGEMTESEEITFFQSLVDSGLAWTLQGVYGRQAARMIEAGLIHA